MKAKQIATAARKLRYPERTKAHLDSTFVKAASLGKSGNRGWVLRYALEDLIREARSMELPDSGTTLRAQAQLPEITPLPAPTPEQ